MNEPLKHCGRAPRLLLLALLPIGDTLFTTPTMRALRDRYPEAHITALVHAGTAPLLKRVPVIDEVVILPFREDWAGPGPLARALRRLHARHFDAAIDFTTPAYKWVSFVCGIPLRTYMKFDRLWWLLPGEHAAWRATHATRHYYECARELDLPPWDSASAIPSLALRRPERDDARRFLSEQGVVPGRYPLVALHVGAAGLGGLKRWPPQRFAALADRLREQWNARIVLLGSRDELALVESVAVALRTRPIVAAGATTLLSSIAVIEASDLFIGNDSGPLHAAAAVGTPYVGIYGPTVPANFGPIPSRPGQGLLVEPATPCCTCGAPQYFVGGSPVWRRPCCQGRCRALDTVTVDAVYTAAEALLREAPRSHGALGEASALTVASDAAMPARR